MPRDLDPKGAILRQLLDRFRYATSQWENIRAEGREDLRYLTGNPWTADEILLRKGRPLVAADQLTQYANQLINDVRQNPRAIKVSPRGAGATNKTAELRANKIREIEYRSHAQLVYTTMFGNTAQRGYGFMAVRRKWASDRADLSAFNQELWLEPIVNPDLITPDPDALMPDGRDMRFCFEGEWMDVDAFKDAYPQAEVTDFVGSDVQNSAPLWFRDGGKKILVQNYWVVKPVTRRLLLLKPPPPDLATLAPNQPVVPQQPKAIFADELEQQGVEAPKKGDPQILHERDVDQTNVCMYTTNGVEILDKEEWPGKYIPIIACYGKVEYVDSGSGPQKVMLSLIRLARDLQKGFNYCASSSYEAIGMAIRSALLGWEGQADTRIMEQIQKSLHEPVAFIGFKMADPATGIPFQSLPVRPPNQMGDLIQATELLKESTRRDIQAAIGSNPLPTQAQKRNEKSGVALKQIQAQEERGSYHFVDHYDDAIRWGGVVLDDMLDKVYDAARDIAVRKVDGTQESLRINDPSQPYDENTQDYPRFDVGDHDIIISTGPALDSEREQASDFVDTLMSSPAVLQILGPLAPKFLAIAIRLKNVGHLGDEMADLLAPPEQEDGQQDPKAMAGKLQEAEQKLQQLGQLFQQAQEELKTDQVKVQGEIQKAQIDSQTKRAISQQESEMAADKELALQVMKNAAAIAIAHINARTKGVEMGLHADEEAQALGHEAVQNEADRQHERDLAAQEHAQALQQNEQGQAHALEQGQQAADLAPEPSAEA